jgi:hypothetical protein
VAQALLPVRFSPFSRVRARSVVAKAAQVRRGGCLCYWIHFAPAGARRFSSSNQFSTRSICVNAARADLRDDFVATETRASGERHHFFPEGTFCFNSSNQFSTTLICVGGASVCSVGLSIRNRWPSADTS